MKKFFKLVMFCLIVFCSFRLGGCNGDRKASNSESKIADLKKQLEDSELEKATMREDLRTAAYAVSSTYDVPTVSAESAPAAQTVIPSSQQQSIVEYVVQATDVSIPQIAAEKEKPFATLVYCGQSFNITTYSEENRESLRDVTFPYYGTVERNGAVVISGVTVNGVYKLAEGSWEPVSGVKFDYVDNTYTFPVRAEGSYINIYMVQSVNSQHYYFGISAGNNK